MFVFDADCIVSVLPSCKLSGVEILANKAQGPQGPWAVIANIPTSLNLQLGNTDSISHLNILNNKQLSLKMERVKKHTEPY